MCELDAKTKEGVEVEYPDLREVLLDVVVIEQLPPTLTPQNDAGPILESMEVNKKDYAQPSSSNNRIRGRILLKKGRMKRNGRVSRFEVANKLRKTVVFKD